MNPRTCPVKTSVNWPTRSATPESAGSALAVVAAGATAAAFADNSRRVSASAAHTNGVDSGVPGWLPPPSSVSSTPPGVDSDPRGEAAVINGASAVAVCTTVDPAEKMAGAATVAGLLSAAASLSSTDI